MIKLSTFTLSWLQKREIHSAELGALEIFNVLIFSEETT